MSARPASKSVHVQVFLVLLKKIYIYFDIYHWKWNSPLTPHVRLSVSLPCSVLELLTIFQMQGHLFNRTHSSLTYSHPRSVPSLPSAMYRVFRNNVLVHNSLHPLPRLHRCKRPSKHSYWMLFFVQPTTAKCWCGRGGKLLRILGKKHNI